MTEDRFGPDGDEISLRDLYLIVKRGLPLIIAVALLSAAAAVLYVSLQGPAYNAEATVVVNPTPLRTSATSSISLDQRNGVNFETYQRLAFSRGVLDATIESLANTSLTVGALRGAGSLERITGPAGNDTATPLTVAHQVTLEDPEEAARAADAWAGATVLAVRETMRSNLDSLAEGTEGQLENLRARLDGLEDQWRTFQQRDDSALLESQLLGISQRLPLTEAYREELTRLLADARSSRQALREELGESDGDSTVDMRAAVPMLESEGAISADTAAAVSALVAQAGGLGDEDLTGLIRRVEMQRLTARIAGLEAQLQEAERQLEEMRQQAELLRTSQAELVVERDRLQGQIDTYQRTYEELSSIQPVIEYAQQLLTGNTRILGTASVPTDPVGVSRLVLAIIAAVVGGMLALLFVFLRAAVSPVPGPAGSETVAARTSH